MTSPNLARLGIELALPLGWREHELPRAVGAPEVVELRAEADGSSGLLQVSRLPDDMARVLGEADDLGGAVAELGAHLPGFGPSAGARVDRCAIGCMATSLHAAGDYPSLLVMVTLGQGVAHLWTWIGPDPQSEVVREAVAVVHGARRRS